MAKHGKDTLRSRDELAGLQREMPGEEPEPSQFARRVAMQTVKTFGTCPSEAEDQSQQVSILVQNPPRAAVLQGRGEQLISQIVLQAVGGGSIRARLTCPGGDTPIGIVGVIELRERAAGRRPQVGDRLQPLVAGAAEILIGGRLPVGIADRGEPVGVPGIPVGEVARAGAQGIRHAGDPSQAIVTDCIVCGAANLPVVHTAQSVIPIADNGGWPGRARQPPGPGRSARQRRGN